MGSTIDTAGADSTKNIIVTKKAIAILLVITIFLSLVGTWVMLNAIQMRLSGQYAPMQQSAGRESATGNVLITINNPSMEEHPQVTGKVILTINPRTT